MTKSTYADRGKWAEGVVESWLDARSGASAPFAWHRFTDTRAARNFVAKQPSDYLVVDRGVTTFLEVKETAQLHRFPKDKLSQFGKLKLFDLAKARVMVLIYRSASDDWTTLDRDDLFNHDVVPKSFVWAHRPSYANHILALSDIFK